jgi:hypothetical protein
MFVGDQLEDIEAETWLTEKPDLTEGRYLIHFWTPSCLRCHTELEILAEIARRRDLEIIVLTQPRYEFENEEHVKDKLEDKNISYYAAHKPERSTWMSENSPKKILTRKGEVEYHSTDNHDLKDLREELSIKGRLEVPHKPEEKHLGLKNSAINPDQRFHGEKEVEPTHSRRNVSLKGRWIQKEDYIEAADKNAKLNLFTEKGELYLTASPQDSIRDVAITVDGEPRERIRIKEEGINHAAELGEGKKHLQLDVEKGLRLYKIDLV